MLSGKEVRRKAFGLARWRFEQLFDLLAELREVEAAQAEAERELEAEARKRSDIAKKGAGAGAAKNGGGRR